MGRCGAANAADARGPCLGQVTHDRLREKAIGMKRSKSETIRRVRLGDLRRYIRDRYGPVLPDDDAGREDLFELLLPISIGPTPARIMANVIAVQAPWISEAEARGLTERILAMPERDRRPTPAELGKRLNLHNAERERLRLWTIRPADMSKVQMVEHRKAKQRARMQRRRRAAGKQTRAAYIASSLAKKKQWETEGISRATWYRRQRKTVRQVRARQTLINAAHTLVSPPAPAERPKERAKHP
jgi:hypothetical protein